VVALGTLMLAYYITCIVFVFGILGSLLRMVAGVSIFKIVRYLTREFLLIFATSSSESGLPRLIAKMEHLGVQRSTVGIVVPTGYSFNLDGTAIYLTMAALFVGDALNKPLSLGQQISLLLFMLIASKGTAAVSGASLATFAAGIQAHRPDLLDGVGLVIGVDRFMSEARALTNFAGNAVATVLIASWTNTIDRDQMHRTLSGESPFDEDTLGDELSSNHGVPGADPHAKSDDGTDAVAADQSEATALVRR
jgi:aerobic C4-dicarboxylate transport protein